MFEATELPLSFAAVLDRRKRSLLLHRVVGITPGEPVRVVEVDGNGHRTGRAVYAQVTYVETVQTDIGHCTVASIEVRMSTDHVPAVKP